MSKTRTRYLDMTERTKVKKRKQLPKKKEEKKNEEREQKKRNGRGVVIATHTHSPKHIY